MRDDRTRHGTPVRFWDDSYPRPSATWPRYDADNNRHVWVRSEAVVRGRKRAIVAWVQIEDRIVTFPPLRGARRATLQGKNSGGHGGRPLVNSTGSRSASRCAATTPPQSRLHRPEPDQGPAAPAAGNYPAELRASRRRIDERRRSRRSRTWPGERDLLRHCPSNPNGDVVYVKNAGDCAYTNSAPAAPGQSKCCNSAGEPRPVRRRAGQASTSAATSSSGASSTTRTSTTRAPGHGRDVGHVRDPRRRARRRQRRRLRRLERATTSSSTRSRSTTSRPSAPPASCRTPGARSSGRRASRPAR